MMHDPWGGGGGRCVMAYRPTAMLPQSALYTWLRPRNNPPMEFVPAGLVCVTPSIFTNSMSVVDGLSSLSSRHALPQDHQHFHPQPCQTQTL